MKTTDDQLWDMAEKAEATAKKYMIAAGFGDLADFRVTTYTQEEFDDLFPGEEQNWAGQLSGDNEVLLSLPAHNNVEDMVSTICHEMGHALWGWLDEAGQEAWWQDHYDHEFGAEEAFADDFMYLVMGDYGFMRGKDLFMAITTIEESKVPEVVAEAIDGKLKFRTIKAGTLLYHGTDCAGDFHIPDGPAWFTWSREQAEEWAGWSECLPAGRTKGPPRIISARLSQNVRLVDVEELEDWKNLCLAFDMSEPSPGRLAQAMSDAGMDGWYESSEVMLTNPEKVLQPDRSENLQAESHDYKADWDYDVMEPQPSEFLELVQALRSEINAQFPNAPWKSWEAVAVEPHSLGDAVARYVDGTYSRPVLVVDWLAHWEVGPRRWEALRDTIIHELRHATQESEERDPDEDEAEHGLGH